VAAPTLLHAGATHDRAEEQAPEAQGMVLGFLVDDAEATRCVEKGEISKLGTFHMVVFGVLCPKGIYIYI